MQPTVNIILSDRNWILEQIGAEIAKRLPNIVLADIPDSRADINYYITYGCRQAPAPTLEMGLFTHMEEIDGHRERFVKIASELDLAVCMSRKYQDLLKSKGVTHTALLSPGVDLDEFDVKLRIGVVGRTYHTGRKGEGLLAQLMDIPQIDWHFTGSGWPRPGRFIAAADLPDFYRSLDYVLVPALYEGGPMCVPEALACGTPVISSDVGWVNQFPHIPFRNGDAGDLRRVLLELIEAKKKLRASVLDMTWDRFAEGHAKAFDEVMQRCGGRLKKAPRKTPILTEPVRLFTHGAEHHTLGGPSIRVPKTAEVLRSLGVPAQSAVYDRGADYDERLVHIFNVWNPTTALAALTDARGKGKIVVFSPIFLDLGGFAFWQQRLPDLLASRPRPGWDKIAQEYALVRDLQKGRNRLYEPIPGYHSMVRQMIDLADHIVLLSRAEKTALEKIGVDFSTKPHSLIRNPVDADAWGEADPALFRNAHGPGDYVLCTGRIEPRKNQMMLVEAMRDTGIRLVFAGHDGSPDYRQKIETLNNPDVLFLGRVEPGSDMLKSALRGAAAFVLPSWSEGASLAALEAAAAGASLVLSDESSEREYFGDLARYCDPGDPASIRDAVLAAVRAGPEPKRRKALQNLVRERNSWERYGTDTAEAYAAALKQPRRAAAVATVGTTATGPLFLDITTLAHHNGRLTGISRVESQLARHLPGIEPGTRFISWNTVANSFVEIPAFAAKLGEAGRYCQGFSETVMPPFELPEGSTVVVAGSAWMQNKSYLQGLQELRQRCRCRLVPVIYDLTPILFPFWFDDGYAPVFEQNFNLLMSISDAVLTDSRSCAADVRRQLLHGHGPDPSITPIRLGDPTLDGEDKDWSDPAALDKLRCTLDGQPMVLAVGAIHARKNYEMLYRVWTRLADEGRLGNLHLVIVGGIGWNGQELGRKFRTDPRIRNLVHILDDVSDQQLKWLYQSCLFTVFPSHYEGWGLPVAESLCHGKLCIATSSSSVPEIAPDLVEHLDPEDFTAWKSRIEFYAGSITARQQAEERIAAEYRRMDWDTTARQIVDVTRSLPAEILPPPLALGEVTAAGQGPAKAAVHFGRGWAAPESWGRWTTAPEGCLRLRSAEPLRAGSQPCLYLRMESNLSAITVPFEIRAGSVLLYSAAVNQRSFPKELWLQIAPDLFDARGVLEITLRLPPRADQLSPSATISRQVGLGLVGLALLDLTRSNPLNVSAMPGHWCAGDRPLWIDFQRPEHRDILQTTAAFDLAWGLAAHRGVLEFPLPLLPGTPRNRMTLWLRPVASAARPLRLRLFVNGRRVATSVLDSAEVRELQLDLPQIEGFAPPSLRIEASSPVTPAELGLGLSPQVQGFGLLSLQLEPLPGATTA